MERRLLVSGSPGPRADVSAGYWDTLIIESAFTTRLVRSVKHNKIFRTVIFDLNNDR